MIFQDLYGKNQIGFQNKDYITQGNSLVVQWLGLGAFTAKCPGSICSQGNQIPEASWHGRGKYKRIYHLGFECGESKIKEVSGNLNTGLNKIIGP